MKKVLLAAACAALVVGVANAADLTLDIQYNTGTDQIEIYAVVSGQTGDEAGLALLGVDLESDSTEAYSALTPDTSYAVAELQKNAGLTNPGTNAYWGTPSGDNLLQLGGGQNTIGYDGTGGPTYPTGVVNKTLATTNLLIAKYDVNEAGLTGDATYTLNNAFGNVIDDPGAGPVYAVSPMATIGYTNQSVVVSTGVPVVFLGTADSIGTVCNLTGLTSPASEPRAGGIQELHFHFSGPPGTNSPTVQEGYCTVCNSGYPGTCAPVWGALSGSVMNCAPNGSNLECTFTPALADDKTYEFDMFPITGTTDLFQVKGLIGDAFADGFVDGSDRSTVHANWDTVGPVPPAACAADVFEDTKCDGSDRSTVHANWGDCAP